MVVREPIAAVEDRTGVKPAAMEHSGATVKATTVKHGTAAMKHRAATVKTSAAVEATLSLIHI